MQRCKKYSSKGHHEQKNKKNNSHNKTTNKTSLTAFSI